MFVPQFYSLIVGANGHPLVADTAVDAFVIKFFNIRVGGEGRTTFFVVRSFGAARGS